MALATGRTLTVSGSYLVKLVKQLALALAVTGKTRATHKVLDGYLLQARATGGRGIGVVIDPPSMLILHIPAGDAPVYFDFLTRDWYDSRLELDDEERDYAELPTRQGYRITRALYDWPSAPLNTPPGGLARFRVKPWIGAGVEAHASVAFCTTVIATRDEVEFNEVAPFGVSRQVPYVADVSLFYGGQSPLSVHLSQRYVEHVAGPDWGLGPYIERSVDLRTAYPVSRAVQMRPGSYDVVVAASTYHRDPAEWPGMITHPRAGFFVLAHSQAKMLDAWKDDPDGAAFEDGRLWQHHYELDELFPVLVQQPYLCRPRYNSDYMYNGAGDIERASEAYKVWINGYYSENVPPVEVGRLPCFINRLCLAASADRVTALAGVTFFTTADWFEIDPETIGVGAPLEASQLFCCNALIRLQWRLDGELLGSELFDLDSTAGPDQLEFDQLEVPGRADDRSVFAQPCALMVVQGEVLEMTFEWYETRNNERQFSITPLMTDIHDAEAKLEESGIRVRWAGQDLFFPSSETGVFCWSNVTTEHPAFDFVVLRDLPESEAPGAVQLSPSQVAFVAYRVSPLGDLAFCVIDLTDGTFDVRSDIGLAGEPLRYTPPHAERETDKQQQQQPPSLSVAQQVVMRKSEEQVQGVVFFSFAGRYPHSLVSRDSGRSWKKHITEAGSAIGVFYAPNVLRTNYATGTAAAVPEENA